MKIKDLPQPIKELALKRQVEQGNKPNEYLYLATGAEDGNFSFKETTEGWLFWNYINSGNFKPFYDIYPQDVDNSKDEFAIGFAEWVDSKYYQGYKKNQYHKSVKEYREGKFFSIKQLLEIYKKEQEHGN